MTKDAAFRPEDIERIRTQRLTSIAQQQKDPQRVAHRLLPQVLYGNEHPYGGVPGDPKAIARFSRADFAAFEQRWLRPDNVKIFVVSDRPLSEIQPLLEERFGTWAAPAVAKGAKNFTALPPRPASQKILLDQPSGRAAVEHHRCAAAPDRSKGRHYPLRHCQRCARRHFPVAAQHGPA